MRGGRGEREGRVCFGTWKSVGIIDILVGGG